MTDGLVIVDKPAGWTSHDVVARVRRLAHTRRVGHAGTLDPMATGVLVLGVDRATRLLTYLTLSDKSYAATIRLGQSTVTDDAQGDLVASASASHITDAQVRAAIEPLTGDIMQVPSAVSAIKVDGQRAYKLARAGESVALAARAVTVSRFDVLGFTRASDGLLDVAVEVDCSSGTYVRALARDLGVALGVGGHLTRLRRTRVGPFTVDHARTLDELAQLDDPVTVPLNDAVRASLPVRDLDADEVRELSFGRAIEASGTDATQAAIAPDGTVVALVRDAGGRAKPVLVFAPAGGQ
jgi:tRNA pseudouridine55 synthase